MCSNRPRGMLFIAMRPNSNQAQLFVLVLLCFFVLLPFVGDLYVCCRPYELRLTTSN